MQAIITNRIRLTDAGTGELTAMATRLTLPNPAYQEALRMGRWTGNMEPTLSLYERLDDDMAVPWGLKFYLPTGTVIDDRTETHPARFEWMGPELRDYQERAVQAALEAGGGVVQAPTGSGKTFLALNLIARLMVWTPLP